MICYEEIDSDNKLLHAIDMYCVGVWPPVSTRQDMGRTLRGGLAHKIKACTILVDVHRKILYSTKYDTFLVTLLLQSI